MENYTFSDELLINYLQNIQNLIQMEKEKVLKKMNNNSISQKEIDNDIDYIKYLHKIFRKTKKQISSKANTYL